MQSFGIQLYSVRNELEQDTPGTLTVLREAGYDYVELYGVDPDDAVHWRDMLQKSNLSVIAAHVDYELVVDKTQAVVAMARTLNYEDIIVPWLQLDTLAEWEAAAQKMDEVGAAVAGEDLRLGYHNHDHEFARVGDKRPFDIIFGTAKPENLFLELDVRWGSAHGSDPLEIIRTFGDRCRFLHLKEDPVSHDPEESADLGKGTIDWPAVIQAGRAIGVRGYIVEQDNSDDPIASANANANFIRSLD